MPPVLAAFYVLRPRDALREWLAQRNVPSWMELDQPHIWSQDEIPRDHDYVGQGEDAETFLKLAVLVSFQRRVERASRAPPKAREEYDVVKSRALSELLGPPPLTVAHFDRWWFLERAGWGASSVESTLAHTPVRTLRQVRGPDKRSPTVEAHRSSYAAVAINGGPRPVGEWWEDAIRWREQDVPRLRCAVGWVLERLAEKTPHRTCALRVRPFCVDGPIEAVIQVPGWTLHESTMDLLEGVKLTLEDFERMDDTWTVTYRIYSGERRATLSGTAYLQLERAGQGWKVCSGVLKP